jgi:hypothetical protein
MHTLLRLAAVLAIAAVSACSSNAVKEEYGDDGRVTARTFKGGDADYAAYVAAMSQQQPEIGVDASACAGEARCVENLAAFAAIRAVAGGGQRPAIAPPAAKRTFGDRIESVTKAAIGVLPGLGGIYAGMENAKEGRREREALYGTFGRFSDNLATLGSRATYQVGGDMTLGDRTETNISDSYNDSSDRSSRRDTLVDSGNTTVDGDGNATGEGNTVNNGDWRDQSDGPFDDHSDDGDDCTDSNCASVPEDPEPAT